MDHLTVPTRSEGPTGRKLGQASPHWEVRLDGVEWYHLHLDPGRGERRPVEVGGLGRGVNERQGGERRPYLCRRRGMGGPTDGETRNELVLGRKVDKMRDDSETLRVRTENCGERVA